MVYNSSASYYNNNKKRKSYRGRQVNGIKIFLKRKKKKNDVMIAKV